MMEYHRASSSSSKRPQSSRAHFNSIMMHHGPPPFNRFQNSMNRPASPPVPTFNFNGTIVEGVKNPTLRYRPRVPGLTDRQQVLLDNFWNIQIKQPNMRLGHEKIIRALEQEFDAFNFNFNQSQHHIHSLQNNLEAISRDHDGLAAQFTKVYQELQTLRMQQKASDTLKQELKIGINIDQHKNKEKEEEAIEQEANEPIENKEITIELIEDTNMEQHQTEEAENSIIQHRDISVEEKFEHFISTIPIEIITDEILLEEILRAKLRVLPIDMHYEILGRGSQSIQELQLQLQIALYNSIFDPKPGMDVSTKIYPSCVCSSTEICNCEPEVSIALARINMVDFQNWHFSYEHKGQQNVVEVTPSLLLEFGYLEKVYIDNNSQLETFPTKLKKVAEDYLDLWKQICISFISSPPEWYKHMHKEEARHIAMINKESFRLYPISHYRWTPTKQHIQRYRGSQILALEEFEDFNYDMSLVAEDNEMYIYSRFKIRHQPYWKPQYPIGEAEVTYFRIKEDHEKQEELEQGDEDFWNNMTEEELHNMDNMMEA